MYKYSIIISFINHVKTVKMTLSNCLSESERSDVGYLSLPDTHSTTQPELESRFYFRICTKDTKEENRKVLQIHKKLRDEAEHYLEPESKHLIGIAYFRQGTSFLLIRISPTQKGQFFSLLFIIPKWITSTSYSMFFRVIT